jgi:integrase
MTPEQIAQLLRDYFKKALEDYEDCKVNRTSPTDSDEIDNMVNVYVTEKAELREQLAKGDIRTVKPSVDDLLRRNGVELEQGSEAYRKLCREMLKVQIHLAEVCGRREVGDYSGVPEAPLGVPVVASAKEDQDQGILLTELIAHYAKENRDNGTWTPKSEQNVLPNLNLLVEVIGDVPVKTIDRRKVSEFRDALKKLPPNMKKNRRYRDKTIQQILKMEPDKTLGDQTINNILSRVTALFNHAKDHGFIDHNPAGRLLLKKVRRSKDATSPFSKEDLIKLFHSKEYREDGHRHPYQFWIPLLALFTGARQNELAQLHLEDIKEVNGVWVIDINDKGPKKLKNLSSRRMVPLHPILVEDLGFLKFVERQRKRRVPSKAPRLFPELKEERDGFGRAVSRWFNKDYKEACGIAQEGNRKKTFHSFRDTFATHLAHKKVDDKMLKQTLGHSDDGSTTFNTYVDDYPPDLILREVIGRIDYEVDLDHLKRSEFVGGIAAVKG